MTLGGAGTEDLDRLAEAFARQSRRGEAPSIDSVAAAHPALADEIRELFPVLALMEGLKAAAAPAKQRTARPPERAGDYEIGAELGRGGMGTVYEGLRVAGDGPDRVAVKLVHTHLLERPEFVARFLQEAASGRRVAHENVVRTLGTGVVDVGGTEVPYILLEHVEGQNLRALLQEVEAVPERLCRHIGIRLADALAAIHAAGLIHRDVKPENVVITLEESVKLMDLGVAVVQDRLQRLSETGEFVGSLLYAAPGQVAGEPPHPGWDLHALGILLYELATGAHPALGAGLRWLHAGESARTALTRYDALSRLSPFFAAVIESMLAADDDHSLDSAVTLRDVLLEGESSAWWKERRDAAVTPAARLGLISGATAFYGRKTEWELLDGALAAAVAGRGQVVLVEGEAGIGKSRLLLEWAAARTPTQAAPRTVVLTHAPGAAGDDELQLAAALGQILGDRDLDERLTKLLGSRARLAPELARRLRGRSGAGPGAPHDVGWLTLIQALAEDRPLLLVVEDLHFAISEEVERFLYFARGATTPGFLIVGTFRPEGEPQGLRELAVLEHVHSLPLEGLDTEACRLLLREAASTSPPLGASAESLAERSDRNPMFLLELVRRAATSDGTPVSGETPVPDTIRGFLAARIASLAQADRELLETAACQGYEFDPVVVAEASGARRVDALKRFARIEHGRQLLRAAGTSYQFQHHLVQEVLYADLHPALREAYHAAIGEALERRIPEPLGAEAVALCTHFLKGGIGMRARPYLGEAMRYLTWECAADARVTDLAREALSIDGLLEGKDRAFALDLSAQAFIAAARYDEAQAALEEALPLSREAGVPSVESDVLVSLAWLAERRQRPKQGLELYQRASLAARTARDVGREAVALSRGGMTLTNQGRLDEADKTFRRAFAALGDADEPYARNRLTVDLASLRILQGRLDEAADLLSRAERLAHEIGDPLSEFSIATEAGRLAFRLGRFDEAVTRLEAALDLGHELDLHHRDAFHLLSLGQCHQRMGRFEEALQRLVEARDIAGPLDDRESEVTATLRLVALRAERGELGGVLDDLAAGRELARATALQQARRVAALVAADLLSLHGRFEEANEALEEVHLADGDQRRGRTEVALASARGVLREREGRLPEALAHYEEAEGRAREAASLTVPHAFRAACLRLRLGRREEAETQLQEVLAWARERGVPALAVLAQAHLAGGPQGDALSARIALEHNANRLAATERIEAWFALWEADGERSSLEAARRELGMLSAGVPAGDRETMLSRVDLFRRVTDA